LNYDWVFNRALSCGPKDATTIKKHVTEEPGVGCQLGCIDFEALALYLKILSMDPDKSIIAPTEKTTAQTSWSKSG